MQKILGKAKSAFSDTKARPPISQSTAPQDTMPSPPTVLDVLRYRYHHGANLGGCFVLEKWLWPGMYEHVTRGDSELDAVQAYAHQV